MTARGKSVKVHPSPAAFQVLSESEAGSSTGMESSVDLFISFDDTPGQAQANLAGDRLLDLRSESAEENERNHFKVLFDSAADGVIIVDAETMRILLANQIAAEMYGFECADDLLGVNPLKFVHPDDRDRVLRIIAQDIIHDDLRLVHKFRAVSGDGRETWLRAAGTRTEYQGRLAALVSIRDITTRKLEAQERQKVEDRLEFVGRLASVGELATGVGHELNDPIAAILAYDQLLMARQNLDDIIRSGLEAIFREALRASTIAENLLLFGRRHKPEKSLVQINGIVQRAIDLCSHQLEVNNIETKLELRSDLPLTLADPGQIQQVLVNLISNAEHAMAEAHGRGVLRIETEKAGDTVRIKVADDGPGIPEEDLTKVFDPLYTSKGSGKATGLGLTVCYGLVEGHGGRITAHSRAGEGTTFLVEIPIYPADELASS